jgi:4-amino-4-deoxy-L-arabinose transferase-like glycosyltransferase
MRNPPAVTPGSPSERPNVLREGLSLFCQRHYPRLAVLTLLLAALNIGYRLDREVVTTWDESLYATSAAEMAESGNWLVTTFHGDVDYYNTKPPLNVWMIAASFRMLGTGLLPLRLPSALAAFLTVWVLQWWCRRCFGALPAILTTVVLSTTFAFLYVHSGRSGNPDAWLTLVVLLTVVTLWAAKTSPLRLAWLGPLAAAAFLLKGSSVLLPLAIVGCVLTVRRVRRTDLTGLLLATGLFLAPAGAWAVARWRFDQWRFFDAMYNYDFVARTLHYIEGHEHGPLYYLHVLQKDHYDWLSVAVILLVVLLITRRERSRPVGIPVDRDTGMLLAVWAGATLLIPSVMATKLAWYLDPFYPVFAIGVTFIVVAALDAFTLRTQRREQLLVTCMVALGFVVAEGKLVWYSYHQRDLSGSLQGFFLESSRTLEGRRVIAERWDAADQFVLEHIAGGTPVTGDPQQVASRTDHHDLLILESSKETGWALTSVREISP